MKNSHQCLTETLPLVAAALFSSCRLAFPGQPFWDKETAKTFPLSIVAQRRSPVMLKMDMIIGQSMGRKSRWYFRSCGTIPSILLQPQKLVAF